MLRLFLVVVAVAIQAARGDGGEGHVHHEVRLCGDGITCDVKGSICKDGTCQCPDGYLEDCGVCEDVDECATQADDCNFKLGQECKNTNGSYDCPCREGLRDQSDGHCEDFDECLAGTLQCGPNAQCNNLWAGAACECCAGYKVDPNDDKTCIREPGQALPADGQCCACQGSLCHRDGEVCGSDGVSYDSYRAMAQGSCGAADVNYPGPCQDACSEVQCQAEHSWCKENQETGEPECVCPTCEGGPEQTGDKQVCGTDGVTYVSICHLQKAACEDPMYQNIEVRFEGIPCPEPEVGSGGGGGGGNPSYPKPGPWTPWSECSEQCRQGEQTRTRDGKGLGPDSQTRQCYRSCNEGPCHPSLCHAPHAICIADANNNTACACPTCLEDEDSPVCGRVGDYITTFDSECAMLQAACEQHEEKAEVLEDNACEAKPEGCGKVRHFETYEDVQGCRADRALDVGLCYGGCDTGTGKADSNCCTATKIDYGTAILACPDGTRKNKFIKQIKACGCMEVDEEDMEPWIHIQPKLTDLQVDDGFCSNGEIKTIEIKNNMPKFGEKLQALVEVSPNAQAEDITEVKTRPDHDSFILKPSHHDLDETPTMPGNMEMAIFTTVFRPTSDGVPKNIHAILPKLKDPTVFTYPSKDGTLKVLTTFTSENGKDYDALLPKFAELFDVAPYYSLDDIPEQDVPVILLAKPHSTTTVTKCVPTSTDMPQMDMMMTTAASP